MTFKQEAETLLEGCGYTINEGQDDYAECGSDYFYCDNCLTKIQQMYNVLQEIKETLEILKPYIDKEI